MLTLSRGLGGSSSIGGSTGSAGGSTGSTGATEYSTTNTQVPTVDEADYIKNDGNTIFVLSSDGLHVIDAWPAAETHEIAHLSPPGEPRRLYFSTIGWWSTAACKPPRNRAAPAPPIPPIRVAPTATAAASRARVGIP